jgi:hypothetical protein
MLLENFDIHIQKNEIKPPSPIVPNINSKWVKDFNMRPEAMNLLKENKHFRTVDGARISGQDPKSKARKIELCQINMFLHSKGNNHQSEEAAYRIGENTYKLYVLQGANILNI